MTTPAPVAGEGGVDAYAKLAELGLTLPKVVPPLASYVPAVQSGNYVYVSGQLPLVDGKLPKAGKVGAEVTGEEATEMARICGLNALAAIESLVGLGRLVKIVKLTGFVASAPGFTGQPAVVNGASNLFGDVFGEQGRHARSAVGVSELPLGAPVEVEVIAEVA
ncbi:RidA family protein [Actinoplanes sp. NPDC024001]|uniref:RidA family protein n=1 Tax=Actinoplanes sp. NPDC024001 TaxID=3154598 RepID=UPI0033C3C7BE